MNKYQLDEPCIKAPGKPVNKTHGHHIIWDDITKKRVYAHRFAFWAVNDYWPKYVLHKCGNAECWNPNRLYDGSSSQNQIDSVDAGTHAAAKKTHCPRGHLYSHVNSMGRRVCRICLNENARRFRSKK